MATASTSTGLPTKEEFLKDDYVPVSALPARSTGVRGFAESSADAVGTFLSPVLSPLQRASAKLDAYREHLELPYPGQVDQLGRECKNVHLNNYMFDGARADLSKSLNMNPAFQVTHSFTMGASQPNPMGGPATAGGPGTYNFAALYATNRVGPAARLVKDAIADVVPSIFSVQSATFPMPGKQVFMQGSVDHEGALNGRFNYGWSDSDITKVQANIQSSAMVPSMIQLEHDRAGRDYSLNFKAYNPGVTDATGVFMGSYLQSVTKRLALGAEVIWQRPNADVEEANMSYMAKYVGGEARDWIATAQLLGNQGVVQGSYWQRLSDKVEAGAELTFAPAPQPKDRKASATLAAKYDFRLATLRAQLDSAGKVSAYLEQRFTPAFSFLVTGEIDHWKNSSKFGIGIQLESSTLDEAEAQAQASAAALKPPV